MLCMEQPANGDEGLATDFGYLAGKTLGWIGSFNSAVVPDLLKPEVCEVRIRMEGIGGASIA